MKDPQNDKAASDGKVLKTDGEKERPLVVVGWIRLNGRINVVLSDGRTLTELDESLGVVTRAFAVVDGKRVYLRGVREREVVGQVASKDDSNKPSSSLSDKSEGSWHGQVRGDWRLDEDGVVRLVDAGALTLGSGK